MLYTRLLNPALPPDLRAAADVLIGGGLLAFPTETVYGLGARADLPEALERLLAVKGRAAEKKMAVLVCGPEDITRYANPVPERARRIAARYWPGPVTIVVPTPDGDSIGLRCPDVDFLRRIIALVGAPVFAPSANPGGLPPALNARQVLDYFEGRIEAVLDGGQARVGEASTVVRVTDAGVEILRAGAVAAREIEAVASQGG